MLIAVLSCRGKRARAHIKETFIKIVLPLIVAENERILADKKKLEVISQKKFTTDFEKQWLRQKLLEYDN